MENAVERLFVAGEKGLLIVIGLLTILAVLVELLDLLRCEDRYFG